MSRETETFLTLLEQKIAVFSEDVDQILKDDGARDEELLNLELDLKGLLENLENVNTILPKLHEKKVDLIKKCENLLTKLQDGYKKAELLSQIEDIAKEIENINFSTEEYIIYNLKLDVQEAYLHSTNEETKKRCKNLEEILLKKEKQLILEKYTQKIKNLTVNSQDIEFETLRAEIEELSPKIGASSKLSELLLIQEAEILNEKIKSQENIDDNLTEFREDLKIIKEEIHNIDERTHKFTINRLKFDLQNLSFQFKSSDSWTVKELDQECEDLLRLLNEKLKLQIPEEKLESSETDKKIIFEDLKNEDKGKPVHEVKVPKIFVEMEEEEKKEVPIRIIKKLQIPDKFSGTEDEAKEETPTRVIKKLDLTHIFDHNDLEEDQNVEEEEERVVNKLKLPEVFADNIAKIVVPEVKAKKIADCYTDQEIADMAKVDQYFKSTVQYTSSNSKPRKIARITSIEDAFFLCLLENQVDYEDLERCDEEFEAIYCQYFY